MKKIFTILSGYFLTIVLTANAQISNQPEPMDPYSGLNYRMKNIDKFIWDVETEEWVPSESTESTFNSNGLPETNTVHYHEDQITQRDSIVFSPENYIKESYSWQLDETTEKWILTSKTILCIDDQDRYCGFKSYSLDEETNELVSSDIVYEYKANAATRTDTLIVKVFSEDMEDYIIISKDVTQKDANGEIVSVTNLPQLIGDTTREAYTGWLDAGIAAGQTSQVLQDGEWVDTKTTTTTKQENLYISLIDSLKGDNVVYRNTFNADKSENKLEKSNGNNWLLINSTSESDNIKTEIQNYYNQNGELEYSQKIENETNADGFSIRETYYSKEGTSAYEKTQEELNHFTFDDEGRVTENVVTYWTPEEGEVNSEKYVYYNFITITSVHDVVNTNQYSIYPNPSNGIFHLENFSEVSSYRIYNTEGQIFKVGKNDPTIDLTDSPSGIYFIEIVDGDNIVKRKIMKY